MRIFDKIFIHIFLWLAVVTGIAVVMGYTHQLAMFGLCLVVYLGLKWDLRRENKRPKNKRRKEHTDFTN